MSSSLVSVVIKWHEPLVACTHANGIMRCIASHDVRRLRVYVRTELVAVIVVIILVLVLIVVTR